MMCGQNERLLVVQLKDEGIRESVCSSCVLNQAASRSIGHLVGLGTWTPSHLRS